MRLKKLQQCIGFFMCIGIFIGFMFQSSAATPSEDMENSIIYIKNLTERPIDNIRNTQFIESKNKSVVSVVDKATLDEAEYSERVSLTHQMREDLSQKKTIMFYGDKTNLSLEQMAELLKIQDMPVIEYADNIAMDNLNYLQAVYFQEKADGSHVVGYIYDFTNVSSDEKFASAIKACVQIASEEATVEDETASISLQLRKVMPESGNPPEVKKKFQWDEGYVELYVKATRREIGDSETAWEIKKTMHITPDQSKGWQTRKAFIDIAAGNDIYNINSADEYLVEYMPKVSVNNSSDSFAISSTITKDFVNVGITSSHSYSYSDIECKPQYKPGGKNYCSWEFAYEQNTSAAKYSSSHYPVVHMRNKQYTFRFFSVNQICFTKQTSILTWSDENKSTGQINFNYADLLTKN